MSFVRIASLLACLLIALPAWAQGKGGAGPGGGGPGGGAPGGSPFGGSTGSTTVTPSVPSMSTPAAISAPGGTPTSGSGGVALDPLSTPAAGSPPPVDRYRELHGHAHLHLCKAQGCDQYCDGRERAMGADKRETFVKQCRSYCLEKC